MTCSEFADRYRALAPSPDYYVYKGLSKDYELSLNNSYDCRYLGTRIDAGDELLNLILNFDLSKVEIGAIALDNNIIDAGDFYVLGTDESDPIWMNKFSHEIEVRDFVDNSYTIYKLAANGANFLEAVYCAHQFIAQAVTNAEFNDSQLMRMKKAKECANMAGGDDYLPFYESILLE